MFFRRIGKKFSGLKMFFRRLEKIFSALRMILEGFGSAIFQQNYFYETEYFAAFFIVQFYFFYSTAKVYLPQKDKKP